MYIFRLLVLTLFVSTLAAENIDTLLKEYQAASELSYKTKDESAGNLIVYTRDDLERMQAQTLKDLLKSLRFFPYYESRIAQSDALNLDPISNNSKAVRVFLNDHEMASPLGGSGFIYFGDMELDFIDHVEIYTGFPSFDFSLQPAFVIIRLYTKSALHDEGGKLEGYLGTNDSYQYNMYYTNKEDAFSYFAYLGQYNNKRESQQSYSSNLQRDQLRSRFYGSLSNAHHKVELHVVQSINDAFLGTNFTHTILDDSFSYNYFSLSTSSDFLDNTLIFNNSYTKIDSSYNEDYVTPFAPVNASTFMKNRNKEEMFTSLLKKEYSLESHTFNIGIEYQYKHFNITDITYNGIALPMQQPYSTENIFTLFLQDSIKFNSSHELLLSIMDEYYTRNENVYEPNNLQGRLGYNYLTSSFNAKSVLAYQQFATQPYMLISPVYGNADLISENYTSATQEFTYMQDRYLASIVGMYSQLENYPILDFQTGKVVNNEKTLDMLSVAFMFKYHYRQKDSFEFNYNYLNTSSLYDSKRNENSNILLRSLNTIGDFDLFNEALILWTPHESRTAFDYSMGIIYHANDDLTLQLKGENLFNQGIQGQYYNGYDKDNDTINIIKTQIIDQKVWLGMGWLF